MNKNLNIQTEINVHTKKLNFSYDQSKKDNPQSSPANTHLSRPEADPLIDSSQNRRNLVAPVAPTTRLRKIDPIDPSKIQLVTPSRHKKKAIVYITRNKAL